MWYALVFTGFLVSVRGAFACPKKMTRRNRERVLYQEETPSWWDELIHFPMTDYGDRTTQKH